MSYFSLRANFAIKICLNKIKKPLLGEWLTKDVTVCKVSSVKKSCLINYVDSLIHF